MESHDDATNDENLSGPEGSNNDFKDDVLESRANQNPKPLISERKLAANRLNAQRSTGPKTAEGKQRSAQNSFKSGIFVRQLFLNTDSGRKEWEAYEGVAAAIYEHYQPVGIMEEMLVDKVVSAAVRSARVLWFETAAFARNDTFWGQAVDKVLRYQISTDRQLTKAIELLEDVQRKRKVEGRLIPVRNPGVCPRTHAIFRGHRGLEPKSGSLLNHPICPAQINYLWSCRAK